MPQQLPDTLPAASPAHILALDGQERLLATFVPDLGSYWKSNALLSAVVAVGAGAVLVVLQNPHAWAGPVAALLAIWLRAAFLKSEVMQEDWRLTSQRVIGPAGRVVPLAEIRQVLRLWNAVQITTKSGDKIAIKYQADASATAQAIQTACAARHHKDR